MMAIDNSKYKVKGVDDADVEMFAHYAIQAVIGVVILIGSTAWYIFTEVL